MNYLLALPLNFQMNNNHYDPKVIYPHKIKRIKRNIACLAEAVSILEGLPLKIVQAQWKRVAEKDLPQKSNKNKPINKGLFKQCVKKTVQAFIVSINLFRKIKKR